MLVGGRRPSGFDAGVLPCVGIFNTEGTEKGTEDTEEIAKSNSSSVPFSVPFVFKNNVRKSVNQLE